MSVVMISNRRASVLGWDTLHGVRPVRARVLGAVRGVRRGPLITLVAVLCAVVIAAAGLTPSQPQTGAGTAVASAGPGLPIVPISAIGPISAVLGRDLPGYRVEGLTAANPEQRLRAVFSSRGVTVISGRLRLGISLDGFGYAGALRRLSPVVPVARANRVMYAHGALSEWWANGPAGLEQGFTLSSRPGVGAGPLTFSLGLSGGLRPRLDGGGLYLSGAGGALLYDDLVASDARGRSLPAWFALRGGRALVEVDDRGAAYPVRVDPVVEQTSVLISSNGTFGGGFGYSVGVSGNTVVVGADNQTVGSNKEQGAVYVFVQPAAGWPELTAQDAELTASDGKFGAALGWSVAISGGTVVAGAPAVCRPGPGNPAQCLDGVAYVFQEPAGGWSGSLNQSAELTITNQSVRALFGDSVAISGGTIVVGDGDKSVGATNQGAAYVFQEPGGGWSGSLNQSAELTNTDGNNNEGFGGSVAISGNTIVVGAGGYGYPAVQPGTGYAGGAAYVFETSGGNWSGNLTQSAQLTAPPGAGFDAFGTSVSVSGSTIAVGAPAQTLGSDLYEGAVYVFTQPAAGWSGRRAPDAELTASDGAGRDGLGAAVAVSGGTIAAGEELNLGHAGLIPGAKVVYVFQQPAGGWSGQLTESAELQGSTEHIPDYFGTGALAVSGGTVIVGASDHRRLGASEDQGAAYVFPCSAISSAAAGRQPALAAGPKPSALPAGCPLNVSVNVLQNIRSGLAVDTQYPTGGPVNFTVPTSGGQSGNLYIGPFDEGQKCLSGCANVLVTVIDPATDKPVEGATVTASVDPMAKLDLPGDWAQATHDDQFLCVQADLAPGEAPRCGTDLTGVKTDKQGRAYLIYWAPGLVDAAQTTLHVSAKLNTCGQGACTVKTGTAVPPTKLAVHPYLVYQHTGELEAKEVALLIKFAEEPRTIVHDLATDHFAEHLIEHALEALEAFEHHAAEIAGTVGLVVSTVVHAYEALSKLGEQNGLIATLELALGLSTLGLGEEAYAASVPLDAPPNFTGHILDGLGDVHAPGLPTTLGPSGVLWSDALALSAEQTHMGSIFATRPESVNVKVYEVSHCRPSYPVCGPGYDHLPAQSSITSVENRHGIQAQLCFFFTGTDGFPGFAWHDSFCEAQYAAPYWLNLQPGVVRTLP